MQAPLVASIDCVLDHTACMQNDSIDCHAVGLSLMEARWLFRKKLDDEFEGEHEEEEKE